MKKIVIAFFIFVLVAGLSLAQSPLVKQWDYRFGGNMDDMVRAIQQTFDGGYLLGGNSRSISVSGDKTQASWGSDDFWIVKLDSAGIKQWDLDFGGNLFDYLTCLQQTKDNGYILGGRSNSNISGNKSQTSWGGFDCWVIKTDSSGNIEWDKDFGGTEGDEINIIQQTADGGFVIGGDSYSGIGGDKTVPNWDTTGNTPDFWIIKIDSVGNKQWEKDFGGDGSEGCSSLVQTFDGGYIFSGTTNSGISGDKTSALQGDRDYWIIKTDSLGNKQWDKSFGGTGLDRSSAIRHSSDGGYIIGGDSHSGIGGDKSMDTWGSSDFWLVKIDSLGNKLWDKDYGGTSYDNAEDLIQTSDGGFLMSGRSHSPISGDKTQNNLSSQQIWIIKTDSLGVKEWDRTILANGNCQDSRVIQTKDHAFVLVNWTNAGSGGDKTQPSRGINDYWIVKFYDTTSVYNNSASLLSSDTSFCDKQSIDFFDQSTNNPTSWQWFFPGGNPSSSTLQNPTGIFYNTYGSFDVTLIACNATDCDTLYLPGFINEFPNPTVPMITMSNDTLFSTPAYSYQWYFYNSPINGATSQYYVITLPGDYYVVVTDSNGCAAASQVITDVDEITHNRIFVYPNPSNGDLILKGIPTNSEINIYDVAGRVIYKDQVKAPDMHLQLNAADGIYFLEVVSDNLLFRKKIIVNK